MPPKLRKKPSGKSRETSPDDQNDSVNAKEKLRMKRRRIMNALREEMRKLEEEEEEDEEYDDEEEEPIRHSGRKVNGNTFEKVKSKRMSGRYEKTQEIDQPKPNPKLRRSHRTSDLAHTVENPSRMSPTPSILKSPKQSHVPRTSNGISNSKFNPSSSSSVYSDDDEGGRYLVRPNSRQSTAFGNGDDHVYDAPRSRRSSTTPTPMPSMHNPAPYSVQLATKTKPSARTNKTKNVIPLSPHAPFSNPTFSNQASASNLPSPHHVQLEVIERRLKDVDQTIEILMAKLRLEQEKSKVREEGMGKGKGKEKGKMKMEDADMDVDMDMGMGMGGMSEKRQRSRSRSKY